MRRVVITGIGMLTPVGNDREATWSALLAGKSGAAPITQFDASTYATKFACEVKDWDPLTYLDKREVKHLDRFLQFGVSAAMVAMADAGCAEAGSPRARRTPGASTSGPASAGSARSSAPTTRAGPRARATGSRRTSSPTSSST